MVPVANAASRHWRLCGSSPLPLRDWGAECAAFNPLSGHTHILDFIAGALIQALAQGPCGEAKLQRVLADALQLPADEPLQEQLQALLAQLDEQDLIEPVAPC